jgi:DNA-binding NtrC family response regulator
MGRTARILVVDDEEPVRHLLLRWLRGWGYEAAAVASANDALEEMAARPADILVADLTMPLHDGIWLLERVHQQWPSTLIIVESGAQEFGTILKAKAQGAMAFIPKPIERELLHQAVSRAATEINGSDHSGNHLRA